MSSDELRGTYVAALARIGDAPVPEEARKYTPIFQRDATTTHAQAVKDAASALGALWRTRTGKR